MTTLLVTALKVASIAASGLAPGAVIYALARTPSRAPMTTGMRGLKRRRAVRESDAWALVEPLVRWLGVRLSGLMTPGLRAALERKIMLAGDLAGLAAEDVLALVFMSTALGAGVGYVMGIVTGVGPMLAVLLGILGPVLPMNRLSDASRVRMTSISRSMPHFVELLCLSVGAGLDFPGAVRHFVQKASDPNDPLVEELGLFLHSLQLGRSRQTALEDFAERVPVDAVREFSTTIIQAEQRGASVASALSVLSVMSRLKRSIDAEQKASRAGVAMLAPLGLMFLALLILLLAPAIMNIRVVFA